MAKKFSRYTMRANMLKKVLIRIDYSGVTDINEWIKVFKDNEVLSSHFGKYRKETQNTASFSISNMEEIAQSRSIPLNAFQSEPLHRFSEASFRGDNENQDREDNVIMEVTGLYMAITIDCVNYKNMDVYIDFLCNYIQEFIKNDRYIDIQRIGIRKIGGDVFCNLDEFAQTFETNIFTTPDVGNLNGTLIDREYHDRIIKSDGTVKVNFSRRCRAIPADNGGVAYQALLDIDGYVDKGIIKNKGYSFPDDIKDILQDKINDYLFDLYKLSVTEQYLKSNGEEVQD
ncbi:MAG: hypothetical protein ACI4B3_10405 [Prevotella sp.]